jgi:Ca2+:H+ antiporter
MSTLTSRQRLMLGLTVAAFAAAGILHYATPGVAAFVAATVALGGVAWTVGLGTEELGAKLKPGATGVLQSTLGNLPELFIVCFALADGEVEVARTSIIGSLFANALLMLGIAIVIGATVSGTGIMRFNVGLPNDTMTLFLLPIFLIVCLDLAISSHAKAAQHVNAISIVGAVVLLVVYAFFLHDYLGGEADDPDAKAAEAEHHTGMSVPAALGLLAAAGGGAAFVSDWFVAGIDPFVDKVGISKAFAGLVIVAIAGNASENLAGLQMAARGQSDLAISIIKNSVAQISCFLWPMLILISQVFDSHLDFTLEPLYAGALVLSSVAVWQVTTDGRARRFEGMALIGLYLILGYLTLYQ